MTTELEHLDELEKELQAVFDSAVDARDKAQTALEQVNAIKHGLTRRRIELLKASREETL